jgi:spore maturation protein A
MLNIIWLLLLVVSVVFALLTGHVKELVGAATESSVTAFKLALGLTGVLALFLGLMRIAQDSGLIAVVTRLIAPGLRYLFPDVPPDHPAMAGMAMNMVANMFGLNNAATPLGLKAMRDLDELNKNKGTATDAMCMFLAVNTSSIQLIPAGAIGLLAAGGSADPTIIVAPALIATTVSTITGILAAKILSRMNRFRIEGPEVTPNDA